MQNKLELIWNDFHKEMEGFIFSRIKEREVTKDILQDVFIKIQNNIETLKDETKLSSWIYQITRNAINDYFRKLKPQVEINDYEFVEESESSINGELEHCLTPFINQLDDKYKEAIILTEFKGLSQKQLAEKLNISYSGAKSRVQRAKEYLKNLFADCCTIQSDRYGNVVDYEQKGNCNNCCN
ncbi:MAG TPA: RNA polymerase sigma factor SigZ [Chitinophagaceae bacterium]|nr:RNA polymerase sigma factor SigZ [Chitinophagaceae bacterium]HCT22419.1 RNA polymerase sigma factor SigZ [Chitinophagaceae bacterium]